MMSTVRSVLAGAAAGAWLLAAPAAGAVESDSEAQATVRETTEKVLAVLRAEGDSLKTDPTRLYELVEEVILPRFDFERMSRWVLGAHWRKASEQQRASFVKAFETLLVRTYSQALASYRNQTVLYEPTRTRSEDEVTVRASIDQGGGPSIPISYEMHKSADGWKVYDVAIEGVSLVINYRSSFGQEITRNGIDGLIQRLDERNRTSSG